MNRKTSGRAAKRRCDIVPLALGAPLFVLLLAGVTAGRVEVRPASQIQIRVKLDGPVTDARGFTWPAEDGELQEVFVLERPCQLELELPGGRHWRTRSWITGAQQRGGTVYNLSITEADDPLVYADCVERVEEILSELGVHSLSPTFQRVHAWASAGEQERQARVAFDGITVEIMIEPDLSRHPGARKWYISCELTADRFYRH